MRKLVAIVLALLIAVPVFSRKQNDFAIKRGINLSHWLSQGYARGRMREQRVTEADIKLLKEAGFDHVRIPIDEEQFWDEQGNKLPEAWSLLTRSLDLCVKYKLRAIVDLHIIRSHYFNAVNEGKADANTLFSDPLAQDRLVEMWFELSDSLKRFPNEWVAYEFMNEPMADAIAVAKKYRLPLFCGEWGVYETAPKEEKYRWISDMIQVFDEHGIAWTMWNYDSGFGFVNSRTHQVADQRLLDILTGGKGL